MAVDFTPDEGFNGMFLPVCDKCGLYYNPIHPHICPVQGLNIEEERKKLKKWLGKGVKEV